MVTIPKVEFVLSRVADVELVTLMDATFNIHQVFGQDVMVMTRFWTAASDLFCATQCHLQILFCIQILYLRILQLQRTLKSEVLLHLLRLGEQIFVDDSQTNIILRKSVSCQKITLSKSYVKNIPWFSRAYPKDLQAISSFTANLATIYLAFLNYFSPLIKAETSEGKSCSRLILLKITRRINFWLTSVNCSACRKNNWEEKNFLCGFS